MSGVMVCDQCGNTGALPTGPASRRVLCDCCVTTAMIGPHECQTHAPKGSLAECPHGLGLRAACVLCNGRADREAAVQAVQPRTFPAKFDGQCPECNLPIRVGDTIAWLFDKPVTHVDCWPTDTPTGSLL